MGMLSNQQMATRTRITQHCQRENPGGLWSPASLTTLDEHCSNCLHCRSFLHLDRSDLQQHRESMAKKKLSLKRELEAALAGCG